MSFNAIFFDLDETLYPSSTGLWTLIRERITSFMRDRMELPSEEIPTLRERYFRQYGTTLRGLQANHHIDMNEYLAYVHDVPLSDYLKPDPTLRLMLEEISIQKLILTNADAAHARRVIKALGLEGCFDAVVDVYTLMPYCKPMMEAFAIALKQAGECDPQRCILLDDIPATTRAARDFGIFTILVGEKASQSDADAILARVTDLPKLTSIWGGIRKS